jgi:hypothetical protein
MTDEKRRNHLVKVVIKDYRRLTDRHHAFISDTVRWAMLSECILHVMKTQDDQALPISLFVAVYDSAFQQLFGE